MDDLVDMLMKEETILGEDVDKLIRARGKEPVMPTKSLDSKTAEEGEKDEKVAEADPE